MVNEDAVDEREQQLRQRFEAAKRKNESDPASQLSSHDAILKETAREADFSFNDPLFSNVQARRITSREDTYH